MDRSELRRQRIRAVACGSPPPPPCPKPRPDLTGLGLVRSLRSGERIALECACGTTIVVAHQRRNGCSKLRVLAPRSVAAGPVVSDGTDPSYSPPPGRNREAG